MSRGLTFKGAIAAKRELASITRSIDKATIRAAVNAAKVFADGLNSTGAIKPRAIAATKPSTKVAGVWFGYTKSGYYWRFVNNGTKGSSKRPWPTRAKPFVKRGIQSAVAKAGRVVAAVVRKESARSLSTSSSRQSTLTIPKL